MPLPIRPLTELDAAAVGQADAFVAQRLAEYAPEADFRRGVLHDIVQRSHAVLETALQDVVDRTTRSRSLLEIDADPTLAEDGVVDAVLSNFRVTRRAGTRAAGPLTIVLDGPFLVTVPRGAVFTAQGQTYAADTAFAAKLNEATVLSPTDRLLTPVPGGSGRYQFTIDVTAAAAGAATRVKRGVSFTPTFAFPRFAAAAAAEDFTGGADTETNAELLARLADGAAVKAPSNRLTTRAVIRSEPAFAGVTDVSEVGHGDAEQVRYHSVFPVAFGGRRDVYVRTAAVPAAVVVTKTAVRVGTAAAGVTWQFSLGRADVPGLYLVTDVFPTGRTTGGFVPSRDVRGVDLSALVWAPDVATAAEAAYSRYATAVVQFVDPAPDTGAATRVVDVVALGLPLVAEIQDFLAAFDRRPGGADVLVRAAVPCFVGVGLTVYSPTGQTAPDVAAIRAEVAAAVNATGFRGRLAASLVQAAVHRHLAPGQVCGAVDLAGRIRRPDGTDKYLRSAAELVVPDEPKRMVSRRTVAFFLDPADVEVAVAADPAD